MSPIDQARREFYLAMLKRFRFAIDEAEKFAEMNPKADLLSMVSALTTMRRACEQAAKEKDVELLRQSTAHLLATSK